VGWWITAEWRLNLKFSRCCIASFAIGIWPSGQAGRGLSRLHGGGGDLLQQHARFDALDGIFAHIGVASGC